VEIQATEVKKLREKTGAGMMECKKALIEAEGDFNKAEKILKELGLAAAKKRDGRVTKEGRIFIKISSNKGIMLELLSETDFVAKNKDFISLGNNLISTIEEKNYSQNNDELEDIVKGTIGIIKENIVLKRFIIIETNTNELLMDYIHGEGKIGVLTKLKVGKSELINNPKVKDLALNICLQIAAYAPLYLSKEYVDPDYLKEQEEIFAKQALNTGKPENVIAGIVKGKISKHLAEICLVDQNYIKDEKFTVSSILQNLGKELGTTLEIAQYIYYKLGSES